MENNRFVKQSRRLLLVPILIVGGASVYKCIFPFFFDEIYFKDFVWIGTVNVFLAILVFLKLKASNHLIALTLIMMVSLLSALYAVEIGIRLTSHIADQFTQASLDPAIERLPSSRIRKRAYLAQRYGVPFDYRDYTSVVLESRASTSNTYAAIPPLQFWKDNGLLDKSVKQVISDRSVLPLSGISLSPTVHCNEIGKWRRYRSDKKGFSNPPSAFSQTADIVLVGDSFAHGSCVPEGLGIGGHLRTLGHSTVNLGMFYNDPLLELASLREYAAHIRPKWLVWLYFEWDLPQLVTTAKSQVLREYLDNPDFSLNLIERQPEIDRLLIKWHDSKLLQNPTGRQRDIPQLPSNEHKSHNQSGLTLLWNFFRLKNLRAQFIVDAATWPREMDLLVQIIREARRQTEAWGGEFIFVYIPDGSRYEKHKNDNWLMREDILSKLQSDGTVIIDLYKTFLNTKDPLSYYPWRIPGHFNEKGYQVIATLIHHALEQ